MQERSDEMAGDIVLEAADLSVGYQKHRPVLSNVSFTVERGEMLGLIGPNGAGKSTLLKTLRGIIAPQKGKVLICGRDSQAISNREFAREAAYLQQTVEVVFGYSVREIVMAGRYSRLRWWEKESAEDEAVADACMEYTGVSDLAERAVNMISGGQRQRVFLAKVLAQQTPLLFLDEPATGLDVFYQEEIFRFCRELCAAGKTVLMVVHELGLAARFCSRLILVGNGKIMAGGGPESVLTPENLSAVYGVPVRVMKNPSTGSIEVFTEPPSGNSRREALLRTILRTNETEEMQALCS